MKFNTKKCKKCGNDFQPTGNNQDFCSPICKIMEHITIDENDCWNWNKCKNKHAYGEIRWRGTKHLTHRLTCESLHGPAPEDKPYALHKCDNPSCCNPDHLRWGTAQENSSDMTTRKRSAHGEKQGRSKLTEKQVIEIIEIIKSSNIIDKEIAKKYNVCRQSINFIRNNKSWTHLPR